MQTLKKTYLTKQIQGSGLLLRCDSWQQKNSADRRCAPELFRIGRDWQIKQLKRRLCHHFLGLAKKRSRCIPHPAWKVMHGRPRIEISLREILLTFLDRPYLHTFSPINMMMNNISWRAPECVSPGKRPGMLCLLPTSSSFLCTPLFFPWEMG